MKRGSTSVFLSQTHWLTHRKDVPEVPIYLWHVVGEGDIDPGLLQRKAGRKGGC